MFVLQVSVGMVKGSSDFKHILEDATKTVSERIAAAWEFAKDSKSSSDYNFVLSAALTILDSAQTMQGLDSRQKIDLYAAALYATYGNAKAKSEISDEIANLGMLDAANSAISNKFPGINSSGSVAGEQKTSGAEREKISGTEFGGSTSSYFDYIPSNEVILSAGSTSSTQVNPPTIKLSGDLAIFIPSAWHSDAEVIITELSQIKLTMDLNPEFVADNGRLTTLCQKLEGLLGEGFWKTKYYWKDNDAANGEAAKQALKDGDIKKFFSLTTADNPIPPMFDMPAEATYMQKTESLLGKYGLILPFGNFMKILDGSFNSAGFVYANIDVEHWNLKKNTGYAQKASISGEIIRSPSVKINEDYYNYSLGGAFAAVMPGFGGLWFKPEVKFTSHPDKELFSGGGLTIESRDSKTGLADRKFYVGEAFGKNGGYLGNITLDLGVNYTYLMEKGSTGWARATLVIPAETAWVSLKGLYVNAGYGGQYGSQPSSHELSVGGHFITSALLGTQAWYTNFLSTLSYKTSTNLDGGSHNTVSATLFQDLLAKGANLGIHYDTIKGMRGLPKEESVSVLTVNLQMPPKAVWNKLSSIFD